MYNVHQEEEQEVLEVQRRFEVVRQVHESALEEVGRATTARARLYATSTSA